MVTVSEQYKLEQDNKRLKEKLEIAKGTPNKTLLENMNLTEKLEKITEYIDNVESYDQDIIRYTVKEILDSQEKND